MDTNQQTQKICGMSLDEVMQTISDFHGFTAPGLVLGSFMVDLAKELIGEDVLADAFVETRHCLPDAIQLFTPCTIGNGWMKIMDWDKFAICLYDKNTLEGYRVWLDLEKTKNFPKLYMWFMGQISKKDLPIEELLGIITDAGRDALSHKKVKVIDFYQPLKKGKRQVCKLCNEAYSAIQGELCASCQGKGYWI